MTLIFAHRGSSYRGKENTVQAFLEAKKLGADWVEFDLRRSLDGTLVVHHDAQLADGRLIAETNSTELPEDVPSLAEALEACQGMGVNIEIKNAPTDPDYDPNHEIASSVVGIASAYLDYEMLLISSFNHATLASIKNCDPKIPTGLLFFDPVGAMQNIELASEAGHNALHPNISSVDSSFVEKCHLLNLSVNAWTVNEKSHIKEMLELGVDGIITDEIELAQKILANQLKSAK